MTQPASDEANSTTVSSAEPTPSGYTLWAVFRRGSTPVTGNATTLTAQLDAASAELAAAGTVIRGFYDVSGLRADADLMIWL
ncbi:MAG: hydrogen peroxide-dependent heme synthase, partial [Mycetocola sp.]